MKTGKRELCTACAAQTEAELAGSGLKLTTLIRGRDQKVSCEKCGKRKYGGVYEIRKEGDR